MKKTKHVFPEAVKKQLPYFIKTNAMISFATAVAFFSVLILNAVIMAEVPLAFFLYPVMVLLTVRSLRALENLGGHEGAHYNWCRCHRKWNDLLSNLSSGWWVLTSAEGFRVLHIIHHAMFGAPPDPCFTRYSMFHLIGEKNRGARALAKAVVKEYVPYLADYWATVAGKNRSVILKTISLHTVLCVALSAVVPGFWLAWCTTVIAPFIFALPVLRLVAEAQEHDYSGQPEFEDTYNNLGFWSRNLVHPAGDAYHLLHHMLPTVPHFRMARVHRILMAQDDDYRNTPKNLR